MRRLSVAVAFVVVGAVVAAGGSSGTASSTSPGSDSFEPRWSVPVDGELLGLEAAGDRVYTVTHSGSTLAVVAFDLSDGSVLWRHTIPDIEDPYGYDGSATDYGLL